MEKSTGNKLVLVHQAIFGEKNRRHVLLAHSFYDQGVLSELERLSDRPDHSTEFSPFTIGYITENRKYYCLMRIMVDDQAERQGMAFAQALIFDIEDIVKINSLEPIYALFYKSVHKPLHENLEQLKVVLENINIIRPSSLPVFKNVAQALLQTTEEKPIIWLGYDHVDDLIKWLWYNLTPGMRRNFAFKLAEKPEKVKKGYTLVFTPENSSYYWQNYNLVGLLSTPLEIEQLSLSTNLLCGDTSAQPLREWIEQHGVALNSILDLQQCERAFVSIENANKTEDAFIQSIAVRELGTIFSTPDVNSELKESIFNRFLNLLDKTNSYKAIIASRNLPLDAYRQGQHRFIVAFQQWLNQKFFAENTLMPSDRLEVLEKVIEDGSISPKWWKEPIQVYLRKIFAEPTTIMIRQFYEMGLVNPDIISKIEQYIQNNADTENKFVVSFPKIHTPGFIRAVLLLSKRKKWYLLHAHTASLVSSVQEAITQQLKFDKDFNHFDGLRLIANQKSNKAFIEACVNFDDERLFHIAGEICYNNNILLQNLNLKQWQGRKILYHSLEKLMTKNNLPDLQFLIFQLFDQILEEQTIEDDLIRLISQSHFANLYDYPKRAAIWDKIPQPFSKYFIDSTLNHAISILEKHTISFTQIQPDLNRHLYEPKYVAGVLANRQISTWLKIQLIHQTNHLSDSSVSEFIRQNFYEIKDQDAIILGRKISLNRWKESAVIVYKVYKQENKLLSAYRECNHLVGLFTRATTKLGFTDNVSSHYNKLDWFVNKFRKQVEYDIEGAIGDFLNILSEESKSEEINLNEYNDMYTILTMFKSDLGDIAKRERNGTEEWKTLGMAKSRIKQSFLDFLSDLRKKHKSFCRAIEQD